MLKCVGYIRTSTDRQEFSLEAQEHKVRAMAAIKDAGSVEIIVDEDESGKNMDRPGARKLVELVKSRAVDMVIIAKLDRITRSVRDLADIVDLFNKKKVALVSVTETIDTGSANGRMFVTLLGLMAQWEREVISERTGDALQAKKRRGERAGNIPYGFRLAADGKLEEEPRESEVIGVIRRERKGGVSLRQIALALNGWGYKTRAGTPWRFQYVANILEAK